jgi:hypothetical protein
MTIDYNLVLLILLFFFVLQYENIETMISRKNVCNSIDNRCYSIVGKYEPETFSSASETLAYLNQFCIKMIRHLRNKYLWRREGSIYRQDMVAFLLSNYNPDSIIENAPVDSNNTSYVEDKGKVFAICLREKASGENKFHHNHILEFVVLHEMAHLATRGVGHDPPVPFWLNFKILLQEAHSIGIHTPVNYAKYPEVYCSLPLNYNPYFDQSLKE